MTSPTDTTGPHRVVCTRCVSRQREIHALEDRLDVAHATIRGLREELAIESDVNVQGTRALCALACVVLGFGGLVALVLWTIGRLAVAIGGAA